MAEENSSNESQDMVNEMTVKERRELRALRRKRTGNVQPARKVYRKQLAPQHMAVLFEACEVYSKEREAFEVTLEGGRFRDSEVFPRWNGVFIDTRRTKRRLIVVAGSRRVFGHQVFQFMVVGAAIVHRIDRVLLYVHDGDDYDDVDDIEELAKLTASRAIRHGAFNRIRDAVGRGTDDLRPLSVEEDPTWW
jgi:hypothetical protein